MNALLANTISFGVVVRPAFNNRGMARTIPAIAIGDRRSLTSTLTATRGNTYVVLRGNRCAVPTGTGGGALGFTNVNGTTRAIVGLRDGDLNILGNSSIAFRGLAVRSVGSGFGNFRRIGATACGGYVVGGRFALCSSSDSGDVAFRNYRFSISKGRCGM